MANYIIGNISEKVFKGLKKDIPSLYEITKRVYDGESLSGAKLREIENGEGLKELDIGGVRYSVKYNKKRKAIGIFARKDSVESLVKDDSSLHQNQKRVIKILSGVIKLQIEIAEREYDGLPWDIETEQEYFDRLHRN
jgi:hypothetical protein